jgi:hypothetical protein
MFVHTHLASTHLAVFGGLLVVLCSLSPFSENRKTFLPPNQFHDVISLALTNKSLSEITIVTSRRSFTFAL